MRIVPVSAFNDNYIWVIDDGSRALVVDPGDAQPVLRYLAQTGLTLAAVLITHHHYDHTGGITDLIETHPAPVYGPDNPNISGITEQVTAGDQLSLLQGQFQAQVISCPGHTLDHIAFYARPWLFCGDTLFAGGCGRMFEGTPAGFVTSLQQLSQLPADTQVFCAHEYTAKNLAFARAVEPDNAAIARRQQQVAKLRAADEVTVPSTLAEEWDTNPFLRCTREPVIKAAEERANCPLRSETEVFAVIRQWKDTF